MTSDVCNEQSALLYTTTHGGRNIDKEDVLASNDLVMFRKHKITKSFRKSIV